MSYKHKVDKDKIPVCNILGVNIAAINMGWLLNFTIENVKKLSGDYMCVSNVHTVVTAHDNMTYCNIQNRGIMAIPDGAPLSTIGRWRGYGQMHRITGPDYLNQVLRVSKRYGYRHFFYGSTEETLEKIKSEIIRSFPDVEIAGVYSPPFRPLTAEEDSRIMEMINDSRADFVWVGLGAPKQEYWMAAHQGKICGFMVGVGAAFDYMAGNIKRAPKWMQNGSLEWVYRLIQDPKRLLKRYFVTNCKFLWNTILEKNDAIGN